MTTERVMDKFRDEEMQTLVECPKNDTCPHLREIGAGKELDGRTRHIKKCITCGWLVHDLVGDMPETH